ncbi:TetR/AcrR family transcriptional regulator [Saccharopolyspora rhizosphaerae]|uniref:TetR/AcrR family transcriptional regulator n=1 Tax=Saccharopolyspora rhizosphaerae TaxID=2492662 RepID=A0A426JHM4_9PSEU|nr:TetR family transcriptional regulator [Saccharopolyspora rhizosphaerae]RRO12591.1 TetR/AcrR family transcriptional regulator [Saccharopolyspora rhizosphaerae]
MPRNAEATKARIFQAATTEFAEHGIAGARVDRIAKQAQANKQLIYAYFGSKDALFTAVLEEAMAELAAEVPIDGEDLPGYVDRLAAYHAAHPHVLRLLMWESLERGDSGVAAESERAEHYRGKVDAVRRAQHTGKVTDAIDPGMIVLLALGTISWPLAVPQLRRMVLGETSVDELQSAAREAVLRLTDPR